MSGVVFVIFMKSSFFGRPGLLFCFLPEFKEDYPDF
jgi:hypothetical protein